MKTISYSNVKYSPRILLTLLTVVKNQTWKFWFCSFLLSFFFFLIHNSNTVWHIWMICTQNYDSTIIDFPFLGWSFMRAKIGELWLQTCITVSFQYAIFCLFTHTSWKLQVIYGHSIYWMTTPLSKMSIFWDRAPNNWQVMASNTHHNMGSGGLKKYWG